jgi:hypothetical protein
MKTIRLISKTFIAVLLSISFLGLSASDQPIESNRIQPDHAPTPFSAEEIYKGCPQGRKIVFQLETFGKAVMFQSLEFQMVEKDEVVFESITKDAGGKQIGSRKMTVGKWKDLQAHASFLKDETVITTESFTTSAGTFECWLYTISSKTKKKNVKRLWFAKKLPGPPICYEEKQDGTVIFKMTMLKTGLEKR